MSGLVGEVLDRDAPLDVYLKTLARSSPSHKPAPRSEFFPSNLYHEGHDQHSRWFLTSLVSSVALTGQAPYANLKTHGMLLNQSGEKMSKPYAYGAAKEVLDPEDLISGSVKLDGQRKHGYGLDTMRLWAISKDTDTNTYVERADIEQANQEVKMLRGLVRILLGNLHSYDAAAQPFDFSKLTLLDKIMACKILKFVVQITEAYEKLALREVYRLIKDFTAVDVAEYYLDVSRQRLLLQEGSDEHVSS